MSKNNAVTYKFGVNYVPSNKWFYSWQKINLDDVKNDLEAIASLGVDHIRMHLRWDLFQPNGQYIMMEMIDALKSILDIAKENNLMVQVTVLNGWMSGFWFMPSFTWNKNIFTDQELIEDELRLMTVLSESIGNHSALLGIDLGNEINVYDMLKKYSIEEGDNWLEQVLPEVDRLFPGKMNVVGVDHQPWFFDKQMSRGKLAALGNTTSIHTWTAFTGALKYGISSEECLCLQEFNIELANAYAVDLHRPVWVQEFGVSPLWMPEEHFKTYIFESMLNATRSDNLWGYTFWCSHDVSREYTKFNPLEYELGLFDCDNNLKPLGKIYKECIHAIKCGERPKQLKQGIGIVIDEQEEFDGWKYGKIFCDNIRQGNHCKFVLKSKQDDRQYLEKRGIEVLY